MMSVSFFPGRQIIAEKDQPDWIVDALIDLVEFARFSNMPRLEETLSASVMVALREMPQDWPLGWRSARQDMAISMARNVVDLNIGAGRLPANDPVTGPTDEDGSGPTPPEES